jgi:hypothetical protein
MGAAEVLAKNFGKHPSHSIVCRYSVYPSCERNLAESRVKL